LRRELQKLPRLPLSALPENTFCRATGTVRPFERRLLEAPLSRRPCVYYEARVIAVSAGRYYEDHEDVGAERAGIEFVLEDDTASAVVDPRHARVTLTLDNESTSMAAFDANAVQRAMLERLDLVNRDWFSTTSLLYREAVIEEGDDISIFGSGMYEPVPDAGPQGTYRDGPPQRFRFSGTAKLPLFIRRRPMRRRA
jgi:hypothetical protein